MVLLALSDGLALHVAFYTAFWSWIISVVSFVD